MFKVEQAAKAPSGYNTQLWLFKINDSSIEIHANFERSLLIVDPDNRELFISLGCAAENLCIAASCKGYKSEVTISGDHIKHHPAIKFFLLDVVQLLLPHQSESLLISISLVAVVMRYS